MRHKADVTAVALALLASGRSPFGCEPRVVIDGLRDSHGSKLAVAATQPLHIDNPAVAGEMQRSPLADAGDAGSALLPRYETCGEMSAWLPDEVRDDIDNRVIKYDGEWRRDSRIEGSFGETEHQSRQAGATATFTIPSTADYGWLAIGYTRAPAYGLAKLYFDDEYVETINFYSPTTQYQCERVYYIGEHPAAEHRLMVRAEGKSGGGSDTYVNLDYFAAGW